MGGEQKRRRAIYAQGFAAVALFVFAHGARAATPAPTPAPTGSAPAHLAR